MGRKTDRTPAEGVVLGRYMGTWYEIARIDHSFERGISHAMAEYTMQDDGTVKVVNSGIRNNKIKTSEGKAKLTGTPGLLRVSFFGPFYSDYRVLMVDRDYNLALVGSGNSNYLWILSRSPYLCEADLDKVMNELSLRGYDPDRLTWVDQGIIRDNWD